MIDAMIERRVTHCVGAVTAFIAMMAARPRPEEGFPGLRLLASGGAPIPPQLVGRITEYFGVPLMVGYGLTESVTGTHATPLGAPIPRDPATGTLSVGRPMYDVEAWIAGEQGERLGPGEIGEIVVSSPTIVSGYWQKPAATEEAMRPDGFRTGDIGFYDAEGWFYLVDRKKDMINAGGFKVWPREVEDVLYTHPAVREAAVIGMPDDYRGETVLAVISLAANQSVETDEIVEFCKARMAAYKYPRRVMVVPELPKTLSGKILKRELRADLLARNLH